jgi:hypothetical protein
MSRSPRPLRSDAYASIVPSREIAGVGALIFFSIAQQQNY